jgi:hypothetical protein
MKTKAARVPDEQQAANATQYAYLRAAGKTLNWLLLSDEELAALAAGVVLARTSTNARQLLEPLGGLG